MAVENPVVKLAFVALNDQLYKELLEAMEQYAVQTNFFLEFIERKCPGLTKVQTVELATLLIVKMAAMLCETETAEVWLTEV